MPNPISFLALGDSYTIGECVEESERWPVMLAIRLRRMGIDLSDPQIIAKTGWRTDELKAAIKKAQPSQDYGLASLLIGVNNQYQNKSVESYQKEFAELLEIAIGKAGGINKNVMVVSIPDYGFTPFGSEKQKSISHQLKIYNEVNRTISEQNGVWYFDITPTTLLGIQDPSLVESDGLHPSGKLYSIWVDLILENKPFVKWLNNY